MARHQALFQLCYNFRKTYARIHEALDSRDPELVADRWQEQQMRMKKAHRYFTRLLLHCKDLYWQCVYIREELADLEKTRKMMYDEIDRLTKAKSKRTTEAYFSPEEEKKVREEIKRKQKFLVKEKQKVDKQEQELMIRQDELEVAIQDTNLAKSSYYRLSDEEIELFETQRSLILEGVEKYGSVAGAVRHNARITMRPSSILHYARKHNQFGQDLEIAKQVFKESLDAELLDRALNGTTNPVFQKGEYIGDYAVKDNKLLIEVAKAKLPKEYNPRVYAAANPQSAGGTTINILSFDGVDETKRGYARNIGVVKSVDDTGRVERITQQKKDTQKMLEFYKNKESAEIIEAEVVDGDS